MPRDCATWKMLDDFIALREQIFAYFGYVEDWRVLPLDDAREYFWRLDGEGPGTVRFADTEEELERGERTLRTGYRWTVRT